MREMKGLIAHQDNMKITLTQKYLNNQWPQKEILPKLEQSSLKVQLPLTSPTPSHPGSFLFVRSLLLSIEKGEFSYLLSSK